MTRLRRRILALKEGIDPADVQAIREGRLPKDGKLAALSALAKTMIEKRGRLDDRDRLRQRSCAGGHRHRRHYTGSVTKTPLEAAFQAHARNS